MMESVRMPQATGTLRGFALILSLDGHAVGVIEVETKPLHILQASSVEVMIVPVMDVPDVVIDGEYKESARKLTD